MVAVANGAGGPATFHWLATTHLGVPVASSNSAGTATTLTGVTLLGFPGQTQTFADLYYNQYRDYDPTTGRYIQADPIGLNGDPNPYVYALANPVRWTDPTGEMVPVIVGGGGFLIGMAADYAYQRFIEGRSHRCVSWTSMIVSGILTVTGGGVGRIVGGSLRYTARSLTRETGKEWSHAISRRMVDRYTRGSLNRILNERGGLNGRWVTPRQHWRHDSYRYPRGYGEWGERYPGWLQPIDRIPYWARGSGLGAAGGVGGQRLVEER